MKDFLFAVILSLVLMVSVAAIAVLVPGAKYVFAFCGLCAVAFVALAHCERRKFEREERRRLNVYDQAIGRTHRAGQRWEPVLDARVRSGHGRDTVRE